jgi:hypothetical protein
MDQIANEQKSMVSKILKEGIAGKDRSLNRFILLNTLGDISENSNEPVDMRNIDELLGYDGCSGKYHEFDWILTTKAGPKIQNPIRGSAVLTPGNASGEVPEEPATAPGT